MQYREISGNHYEAIDGKGKVVGRIKSELQASKEVYYGIPMGEWLWRLYRVNNGQDELINPPLSTLNQAKALLEYHLNQ